MIKVDNRRTMRLLSRRIMDHGRSRNLMAVLAIVMTTFMFTALFTAAASVIKSQQNQEMRMLMNQSHIWAEGLSLEQLELLSKDERVEACGRSRVLGTAVNEQLAGDSVILAWADAKGAEAVLCTPSEGRLPEKENEAAMSAMTLDLLGLPHELGTKVHLAYDTGHGREEDDFLLCGIWEGDPLADEQRIWVSKDYCGNHAETEDYAAYLWLDSIADLYGQEDALALEYDLLSSGAEIGANSAYDYFSEDAVRWDLVCATLLIIFLAGYLIIYNVFRISVSSDIRVYGLLKNIGTTGKQLKAVVRRQALALSLAGIPLGLCLGWLAGRVMTPYLLSDGTETAAEPVSSMHPLIFVASALFSALTVWVGCQMPERIVSKLSPVEALRLGMDGGREGGSKGVGRISPLSMALSGFRRDWKKAVLVILSMTLSLVLMNTAYSVSKSFVYDAFLDIYSSYDFEVSGLTDDRRTASLEAVEPELAERLAEREEVEELALIYDTDIDHQLDETGYGHLKSILEKAEETQYVSASKLEQEWAMLEEGHSRGHVMGLNPAAFARMQFLEGKYTYEDFSSGDYVIIGDAPHGLGEYYETGDTVELRLPGGKSKVYTVLAVGWMPYDLTYRYGEVTVFDCTYYLPEEEYLALGGSPNAMLAGIDVRDGSETAFDQWLEQEAAGSGKTLHIESRMALLEECRTFAKKHYMILGLLSAVLMVIAVLNFFSTTSVSILTQRRELALLEAVGMTRKQIAAMLSAEGLLHLGAAMVLADTAGMAAIRPLVMEVLGKIFYFDYQMSILPSLLVLPVTAALAVLIPLYYFRRINRETVSERLRTA